MSDEHARYSPVPIDVSGIVLPDELRSLTERLAENAHDVWASSRLREGWTWGPHRSDERREHPCLVPYGELPDSERDYDRGTVISTLKVIMALGYGFSRAD